MSSIDALWQRATLLADQGRWDLAEREVQMLLAAAPDFAPGHALLALVLSERGRVVEAERAARTAITKDPEEAFAYRALAIVEVARHRLTEASEAVLRAIELEPTSADHRGLLAQVRFGQERWGDCVAAAEEGLALDPRDTDCLNLRALALTKLGRAKEANASVEASLAHDPENPYTHQAHAYALLHQGDAKGALRHFQEALRRDPTLDASRAGLVEAIKSQNPIYRLVLAPFIWMERFPPQRRTQLIIAVWFAAQLGTRSFKAAGQEQIATILSFSWLGVVLLTVCIVPIFNLLLLLHPVGRHALDPVSKKHAVLLGAVVVVTIGFLVAATVAPNRWLGESWLFWLLYLLPVAGLGVLHGGWARKVQIVICCALLLVWVYWSWLVLGLLVDISAASGVAIPEGSAPAAPTISTERLADLRSRNDTSRASYRFMVWGAALSTWFTMLAPAGRPERSNAKG